MKKRLLPLLLCLALGLCACGAPAPQPAAQAPVGEAAAAPAAAEEPAVPEAPVEAAPDAGAPAAAEETAAYDRAAYEAAAQAVKDEFVQLFRDGIEDFDEAAHPELPWYTAVMTRFAENSWYEGYYDFDGNGVPEMLIAAGDGEWMSPVAVYAFDGQQMRYLCKEYPLGERSHLSRADGLFVVHGSGGAASGILAIYRIAEDGFSTDLLDVIDYQYSDESHVTYSSEMGSISPEEVVSRGLAASHTLDVEPVWSCFRQGA